LEPSEFIFLGTGGGRFATIHQRRKTGGIRFLRPFHAHVDPGPGALVNTYQAGLNPTKIRAVLVSHAHPDHYTDAEVMIEAMTSGATRRRGVLVAPKSVLKGNDRLGRSISAYHQKAPAEVVEVSPGTMFRIGGFEGWAIRSAHTDPDAVGYRLSLPQGDLCYTSDTEYFDQLGDECKGAKLLILAVLRPRADPCEGHLAADEAAKVVRRASPEFCIITNFGYKLIMANPSAEAQFIQQETGVPTIAATDFLRIELGEKVRVVTRKMG